MSYSPYLLLTFLLLSPFLIAQQKTLTLRQATEHILVDGAIDDGWAKADSAADFEQQSPYHGKPPSRHTVAKVLTTDEALYCLIVCYDERENVQSMTGKLDDGNGDVVSIMLDTFNDRRTAYKFAVSAGGVRADCRLLDDARNRDYTWDGVWFASSLIYDWGFVVEMMIPYRSIQYDKQLDSWGLDFDRWRPINSEDLYWCRYEESESQRISKFGKLLLEDFRPTISAMNLEIYPVGISKATFLHDDKYKIDPDAGIDIFYNPSPKLTVQLTANPDFAQIEADPFDFNITRYESYFSERRPFFTEGNEIFTASGRQRNMGFYKPMELFYSRRIGKKLPDGSEVPLLFGTKAFGRAGEWEYGGFVAHTGEKDYALNGGSVTEPRAWFGSVRLKKQILDNSSLGVLFVGKHSKGRDDGVLDIDGAVRSSQWQLAYQLARSFKDRTGDYAGSAGFTLVTDDILFAARTRLVGVNFDVDQLSYVPWRGTGAFTTILGPRWYFEQGTIREMSIYGGGNLYYEDADLYTDRSVLLGLNLNFRSNWGLEINASTGKSKDYNTEYSSTEITGSSWFYTSAKWNANLWGGYSRTFNFRRNYEASYSWFGGQINWSALDILRIGTSIDGFIEGNPDNEIEDITYNARPYFSLTPLNDLNIYCYVDNVFLRSTDRMEQIIIGLLFSYQFMPKSWIYLAVNELRDRTAIENGSSSPHHRMNTRERAAVLKIKYLYYF